MSAVILRYYEVHRDETPCPANDDTQRRRSCPLVGTGIHQPLRDHIIIEHGMPAELLDHRIDACRALDIDYTEDLWQLHRRLHWLAEQEALGHSTIDGTLASRGPKFEYQLVVKS